VTKAQYNALTGLDASIARNEMITATVPRDREHQNRCNKEYEQHHPANRGHWQAEWLLHDIQHLQNDEASYCIGCENPY
jgi:hypothetical protein